MMINRLVPLLFLVVIMSCGGKKQADDAGENVVELDRDTRIKIRQYVAEGRNLYNTYCSNCHQIDGSGLAALFPPVKNSDYLMEDIGRAVCNVKNGVKGKIKVNGKIYEQEMPANNVLTNLDLAEIMTYILNEMNDTTAIVGTKQVREYLKTCESVN